MQHDMESGYGRLVSRALADPKFKQRLIDDPDAALAEAGIVLRGEAGPVKVKVVENTGDTVHIVLPAVPAGGELSDRDIAYRTGGPGDFDTHI